MKIGISNLKGGVGKTTITQNLAVCFAHINYKVCIVDTDTNQNSLSWYGARDEELPEVTVVGATDSRALNKTVDSLHKDYDIILIDGTPNLSEMTTRIILASDILIIPIRPGAHDFRTMEEFFSRYAQAKEFRDDIPAYFLLNEYSAKKNVHQGIRSMLENEFEIPILETTLKTRVAYAETSITGTGVYESADTKAKNEAISLTNEILEIAEQFQFVQ
ncbi:MAG: ParA family protein [Bacteroidota bacterium]